MTHNEQYTKITEWINSFDNADALGAFRKYVDNTDLPKEMQDQLHLQINCRIAHLKREPYFHHVDGEFYLMDEKGNVRIFNTSFGAFVITVFLNLRGLKVKMIHGKLYKVALQEVIPVENFEVVKP